MFTYKNKSKTALVLVGVGTIEAGQTFRTDVEVNHPLVELVTPDKQGIVGTEASQPNAITDANKISDSTETNGDKK